MESGGGKGLPKKRLKQHEQTFLHLKNQENFPDVTRAAVFGSAASRYGRKQQLPANAANTTRPRR